MSSDPPENPPLCALRQLARHTRFSDCIQTEVVFADLSKVDYCYTMKIKIYHTLYALGGRCYDCIVNVERAEKD
jgi:hypothetical protein